jgi:hypothetical protein
MINYRGCFSLTQRHKLQSILAFTHTTSHHNEMGVAKFIFVHISLRFSLLFEMGEYNEVVISFPSGNRAMCGCGVAAMRRCGDALMRQSMSLYDYLVSGTIDATTTCWRSGMSFYDHLSFMLNDVQLDLALSSTSPHFSSSKVARNSLNRLCAGPFSIDAVASNCTAENIAILIATRYVIIILLYRL